MKSEKVWKKYNRKIRPCLESNETFQKNYCNKCKDNKYDEIATEEGVCDECGQTAMLGNDFIYDSLKRLKIDMNLLYCENQRFNKILKIFKPYSKRYFREPLLTQAEIDIGGMFIYSTSVWVRVDTTTAVCFKDKRGNACYFDFPENGGDVLLNEIKKINMKKLNQMILKKSYKKTLKG